MCLTVIEIRDLKITFLSCFPFASSNRQRVTWSGPAVMKKPSAAGQRGSSCLWSSGAVKVKVLCLVPVLSGGALAQAA